MTTLEKELHTFMAYKLPRELAEPFSKYQFWDADNEKLESNQVLREKIKEAFLSQIPCILLVNPDDLNIQVLTLQDIIMGTKDANEAAKVFNNSHTHHFFKNIYLAIY